MSYGYSGTMRAQPGLGAEVAQALADGAALLADHGCRLYVVSLADGDPDLVCVSEVWDSKEAHDASLQLADVRAAIAAMMPKLTGEFQSRELRVVGGLGA